MIDFSTMFSVCASALQLEELWRNILLNQFHDVLPGSSINEVWFHFFLVLGLFLSRMFSLS